MEVLLDGFVSEAASSAGLVHPGPAGEEAEAALRRTLRAQVARLEGQLADLRCEAFPEVLECASHPSRGPRVLDGASLEAVRDGLARQVGEARRELAGLALRQEEARLRLEKMLLDPRSSRGVRISQRELGEPGCGVWRSAPRLGIIGRMMGWWQVKLSSGCPLAT